MTSIKLSYSSMNTLQSCEQKFLFYKISNTPKDEDFSESDSLGIGKAFHQVLELFKHTGWDQKTLKEAVEQHKVSESEVPLLTMMLDKYIEFRKKSKLKIIRCEFGIETSMYVGFIDAIGVDEDAKTWWLVDMKTAARHDPSILPRLAKDMQVGLYSHFREDIQTALSDQLEGYEFGGFRYCQVIKSKATTQKGLESGVKVYEMVIPSQLIDSASAWSLFTEVHDRAEQLSKGEAPRKNFSSCLQYFSPCADFSKCHGALFSKGHPSIQVLTIDNLNDGDLL